VTVSTRPRTPSLPRETVWPYIGGLVLAAALWAPLIGAWAVLIALAAIPVTLTLRHEANP
jgi:hypothetical protein